MTSLDILQFTSFLFLMYKISLFVLLSFYSSLDYCIQIEKVEVHSMLQVFHDMIPLASTAVIAFTYFIFIYSFILFSFLLTSLTFFTFLFITLLSSSLPFSYLFLFFLSTLCSSLLNFISYLSSRRSRETASMVFLNEALGH